MPDPYSRHHTVNKTINLYAEDDVIAHVAAIAEEARREAREDAAIWKEAHSIAAARIAELEAAQRTAGGDADLLQLLRDARHRIANLSRAAVPFDDPLDGPVLRRLDAATRSHTPLEECAACGLPWSAKSVCTDIAACRREPVAEAAAQADAVRKEVKSDSGWFVIAPAAPTAQPTPSYADIDKAAWAIHERNAAQPTPPSRLRVMGDSVAQGVGAWAQATPCDIQLLQTLAEKLGDYCPKWVRPEEQDALRRAAGQHAPAAQPTLPDDALNDRQRHTVGCMEGIEQPYAGAIVMLETVAEFGAVPFIEGAATPMRADCLRIAQDLRRAALRQPGALPNTAYRLKAAHDAIGRVVAGEKELNLTRLHDYLGGEDIPAEAMLEDEPGALPDEELMIALNPRQWTTAHHDAWHRNIPDVMAAFEALREVAMARARQDSAAADKEK